MIITLGQARIALAEFAGKAGKCPESEAVRLFVMEAVQLLLHKGAHGRLRKWSFCLTGGCFTAPPDLEVPVKVKIDGFVESVWSYWYEFQDVRNVDLQDRNYSTGLFQEVNDFATIYELPPGGARISAIPLGPEKNATITLQGLDAHGRDVYTQVDDENIHGETIAISREKPVFSQTTFSKVTSWEKTITNTYVRLYWQIYSSELSKTLSRGLLAEIRPTETHPSYRRFRVREARSDCPVRVTVLGKVRMMDHYHENDVLPVTNLAALRKMAQAIQADRNEKIDISTAHTLGAEKMLQEENEYHRSGEDPFDFNFETSPGSNEPLQ